MVMKEISLAICLLLFLNLYGQESRSPDFAISLVPHMAQQIIADAQVIDSDQKFGFGLRGDVFFQLGPNLQINTGLFYQWNQIYQKDYSVMMACDFHSSSPSLLDSWYEDEFSIHYVGVPLELKYTPSRITGLPYLTIGLSPAMNLSYNRRTISHNCLGSEQEDDEYLNTPNKLLLLASFGLGYEINFGDDIRMLLEPRVGYSMNRIFNALVQETFTTNDSKLVTWGIRLGILIN